MPARIRPLSDLHFTHHRGGASAFFDSFVQPALDEYDATVIAGDIGNPVMESIEHIARNCTRGGKPALFNMGNHCGYRGLPGSPFEFTYWEEQVGMLTEFCAQNGIDFLNRSSKILDIDGDSIRFTGCVGWPEFAAELVPANMTRRDAMELSQKGWNQDRGLFARTPHNDFREIRSGAGNNRHRFTPSQMIAWAKADNEFLATELAIARVPTVVCTHVGPASLIKPSADHAWLYGSRANEDTIIGAGVSMWISGHTHRTFDQDLGGVRIVSNARGYPNENPDFDPVLIVEVEVDLTPRMGV